MHPIRYFQPWRMWRRPELKPTYDVVIVGGGAHGLAIAYELAKRGITKVAVLERSYIGAGGSGRNTTIIRANYRTPEGVAFYKQALRLYERLAQELDYNLLFSQQGHLTLAHAERAVNVAHERAEVNRLLGVDSRVIYPDEIRKLCPQLDLSDRPAFPIMAALYHPPGGVIRHDAVVWAYARQADRMGVEIHQGVEVTGVRVDGGRVTGVSTSAGDVSPDYSPIMGTTEVDGFLIDGGWGTYGFKATPIVGVTMAELIHTGSVPELIAPFALDRFWRRELVSEIAAAAVSH